MVRDSVRVESGGTQKVGWLLLGGAYWCIIEVGGVGTVGNVDYVQGWGCVWVGGMGYWACVG